MDRKLGVLFGQAVGDALGLSAEFLTREQVAKYYPNGICDYDDCIRDRHRSRWQRGSWTDDTDMMLCARKGSDGAIDPIATAEAFVAWHRGGGVGIGMQTYRTLNLPEYTKYPQQAAELVWKMGRCNAAGNGGIMRTSILSVWYSDQPFEYVARQSETFCRLTHFDPRCVGSCVVYNYMLWCLLNDKIITKQDLLHIASGYDNRIAEYIEKVYANSPIESLNLDNPDDMGYTLKTLSVAVWALLYGDNFVHSLRIIIEQGGDADTNGAVAGALLGAKFGIEAIPEKWRKELRNREKLTCDATMQ